MPETSNEELNVWRRRLASEANNLAWDLSEKLSRSSEEDAQMLHAAHASRYLWTTIGTERNIALADQLLGHVHALLGLGPTATQYATKALAHFISQPSKPMQLAFAYAIQANAAFAAGDAALHRSSYAKALEIADTLTDPGDRNVFEATLRVIPKPDAVG